MKGIFISKLQAIEDHTKPDVSENSKDVSNFQQNKLHECNLMLGKLN